VSFHRFPRGARKTVLVCLALVVSFAAALGVVSTSRASAFAGEGPRVHVVTPGEKTRSSGVVRGKYPTRPLVLDQGGAPLFAYPPRSAAVGTTRSAKPITVVYLHGIHGRPENGCPWLREGASELGWLVCPNANAHLPNDTYSWGGTVFDQREVVARAERAAHAQGADPSSANVLVGFSQGAYVAVDLASARLGRYRGLVLVAADVTPSAAKLRDAGVSRVVLAAGELDGSYAPLRRTAERLHAEGVDVRFVGLGKIGHTYQTTETDALAQAIAWAGGKDA
jgi:pimeloyl-ACP methyl ester carboxylesterase